MELPLNVIIFLIFLKQCFTVIFSKTGLFHIVVSPNPGGWVLILNQGWVPICFLSVIRLVTLSRVARFQSRRSISVFSAMILGYPLLSLKCDNFRFWGSTDKPNSALESQRDYKNLEWGGGSQKNFAKNFHRALPHDY